VTFSTAGIAEIPVLPPTTTDGSGLSPVLLATAGLLAVLLAGGGSVFWAHRRRQAAAGAAIALRQPAGRDSAIPVFAGTGPLGDPLKAEAWLDVVAPENFGTFALGEDPVTVGFTGDCTICLPEGADQIGTRLRVWKREGVYMLHNLSRLGKVAIAGKPATWAILEDGDVIELGASRLVFRTSEPASR
jgi:hypothetical protein